MSIQIGLLLAPGNRVFGDTSESSAQPTVIVDDLPRDMIIFDSDLAGGNNAATIPLSGRSDAPAGSAISARAASVDDDGATSTDWSVVGTVDASGDWSGELTEVPRSSSWYRAEIRVDGATSSTAMTTRFGVGLVLLQFGASNTNKGTQATDPSTLPAETIGISASDPQSFYMTQRLGEVEAGEDAQIEGIITSWINDDVYGPNHAAMAAMAATYHKNMPGLKVHFVFDCQSGSAEQNALKDADYGEFNSKFATRNWSDHVALIDEVTKAGGTTKLTPIGAIFLPEYGQIAEAYFGLDFYTGDVIPEMGDGTQFEPYTTWGSFGTLQHAWFGSMPELRTGRTKLLMKYRQASSINTSGSDPSIDNGKSYYEGVRTIQSYVPGSIITLPDHDLARRGDGADTTHINKTSDDGFAEDFRATATSILIGTGAIAKPIPKFDIIQWDENWLRLGWSGGPLTTRERKEAADEARAAVNFRSGTAEALGFLDGAFTSPTHTEFHTPNPDGSPGASALSGDLYIYPKSGTFTTLDKVYWHLGKSYPGQSDSAWGDDGGYKHVPIADIGLPNMAGLLVDVKYGDQEFINQTGKGNLPEPGGITSTIVSAGLPRPDALAASYNNPANFTLEFAIAPTAGAVFRIYDISNNGSHGFCRIKPEGNVQFITKNHTGDLRTVAVTDENVIPFDGSMSVCRIVLQRTAGLVDFYLNGVLSNTNTFGTTVTDAITTGKPFIMFGKNSAGQISTTNSGAVAHIRAWNGAFAPDDTEINPIFDITSDGAGDFNTVIG